MARKDLAALYDEIEAPAARPEAAKAAPSKREALAALYDEIPEKKGKLEALARGGAQGATLGFADEIVGGAKGLWRTMASPWKSLGEEYRTARDEYRAGDDAARKDQGAYFTGGEIGGAIASSFIPGMGALNVGKGARLAQALGKGAALGGVAGLGASKADLTKGDIGGALLDSAAGATVGGAVGGVAHGAGRVLKKAGEAAQRKLGAVNQRLAEEAAEVAGKESSRAAQKASSASAETRRLAEIIRQDQNALNALAPEAREAFKAKIARMGKKAADEIVGALADEDAAIDVAREAFSSEGERAAKYAAEKGSAAELKKQIGTRAKRYLTRSLGGAVVGGGLGELTGEGNWKGGAMLGATAGPGWLGLIKSMQNLKGHPAAQRAVFKLLGGFSGETAEAAGGALRQPLVDLSEPEINALISALRRPSHADDKKKTKNRIAYVED